MAAKIGDTVRFLNDIGGGVIVKIKDNMAYVADNDGFETPILLRECVVVGQASQTAKKVEAVVRPRIPENAVPRLMRPSMPNRSRKLTAVMCSI